MTGPFPVAGRPRLSCLVLAEEADLPGWSAGLAKAAWEVRATVRAPGPGPAGARAPGGRELATLSDALERVRPHAVVVGVARQPAGPWPDAALRLAVGAGAHALGPVPGPEALDELRRLAARVGAVLLAFDDRTAQTPSGPTPNEPERARALGEALHRQVTAEPHVAWPAGLHLLAGRASVPGSPR